MTTRLEMINQLESDLKGKYSKSNLYQYDLVGGVHLASPDTVDVRQYPAVSIYADSDPIKEKDLGSKRYIRWFHIIISGYVKASKWKDIYGLCDDIEKFLFSDDFGGDLEISISLDNDGPKFYSNKTMLAAGVAVFDLRFSIIYQRNL